MFPPHGPLSLSQPRATFLRRAPRYRSCVADRSAPYTCPAQPALTPHQGREHLPHGSSHASWVF
ncbi:hypothetical protein E2C01_003110 [Portunus trituberculatus]|uniref:Uncharacterized protein n=1 Tax=Portunus trituberculatus TaxID=210409 RepID=A0A5B7CSM3_PORTR|nr:hypothetical protein [Portunus trituberculatus]